MRCRHSSIAIIYINFHTGIYVVPKVTVRGFLRFLGKSKIENQFNKANIKYPWNVTERTPKLTGIPPHVTLLSELKCLSDHMANFKQEFLTALVEELNARHLGGDNYHADQILKSLEDTRKHISDVITNRGAEVSQQTNIGNDTRGTVGERGRNI